jgi:GNAT superfamily N-acetyltransferase
MTAMQARQRGEGKSTGAANPLAPRIRRGYLPGLVGRVGELHGRYYAEAWGSGAPFEILLLREFCAFIEAYDQNRDLVLTAQVGDTLVGSIAVVGDVPGPASAQLRFFIVDPAWHGHGVGSILLGQALEFCRKRGLATVFLWTVDGLPQSRHLYEKAGFRVVERVPDARYTVPRDNLRLELVLMGTGRDA